jgi:FKBP-type peptidyl-prolyl cis-trans isomerase
MKKNYLPIIAVLIVVFTFLCCSKNKTDGSPGTSRSSRSSASTRSSLNGENFDKDASYALGMNIGASLGEDGIIPNIEEFFNGFRDSISGNKTRFNEYEAMEKIQTAYFAMMESLGSKALQEGNEFLAENSKKRGINITSTGLQYEVLTEGNGPKPSISDTVQVHYHGTLIDGTVFDSSYEQGFPVEFPLFRVIPGWTEGLQLMNVGSKYKLYIPQELGYGPGGAGSIPPYSVLIFEVELLDIL